MSLSSFPYYRSNLDLQQGLWSRYDLLAIRSGSGFFAGRAVVAGLGATWCGATIPRAHSAREWMESLGRRAVCEFWGVIWI